MEAGLESGRCRGPGPQASSGQAATAVSRRSETPGEKSAGRRAAGRLLFGLVDLSAGRGPDRAAVWRALPSRSCVEDFAAAGLDLSEAGAASPRARRSGDRTLAEVRMAADKKRGAENKLASSLLTRADLCCSR